MPALTYQATEAELKRLFPEDNGTEVAIDDPEVAALAREYTVYQERESAAGKAKKEIATKLKSLLGPNASATVGAYLITWETLANDGYTVAPYRYRKFGVRRMADAL